MRLHKPKGDQFWHVEVVTETGQKKSVNTFCTTKDEARFVARASKIEDLERAGKTHRLTSEVVTLITANRSITMVDALSEWEEYLKIGSNRSPRTVDNSITTVRQWVRETGIETRTVGSIDHDDINKWINKDDGPSGDKYGTRTIKLSGIRTFFKFCCIKRYVLSDPAQLVTVNHRLLTHAQREKEKRKVFMDDEVDLLIRRASGADTNSLTPGFMRAAIVFGRDLALRLNDICQLEWDCFDTKEKVVTVWTDKANTRVRLPMTERVIEVFNKLKSHDDQYLFPKERQIISDPRRRAMLSVTFARLLRSSGFDKGYSFHSLRATYATSMAKKGMTMDEISAALGHKTKAITKVYVKKPDAAAENLR